MEEHANESCSIVYFCASAQEDIYELYHKNSPPDGVSGPSQHKSLGEVYENVRTLLDEDLGGFDEGEVAANAVMRAYSYANDIKSLSAHAPKAV